jgi:hypothetical protein
MSLAEPGEFLARWSRLKQKAGMVPARRQAITEPGLPAAVTVPTETTAPAAERPVTPPRPELPPIESLCGAHDEAVTARGLLVVLALQL